MRKLTNGWHVPEGDTKMSRHIETDASPALAEYEEKQRKTILKHIPVKKTFVDVGANVGVWSITLQQHFDHVISYEPSVRNVECLKLNVQGRTEIRNTALSDFNGEAEFHDEIKNCGNSKLWAESGQPGLYKVPVRKLDDENIENCSLIKMDVQGYEWQVIQGAQNLIETQQPWIAFEVSADVDVICKFLEDRNYDMIDNKSKRIFIYAPKTGKNAPSENAFGRRMGPGPYITLLPEDKQQIAAERYNN